MSKKRHIERVSLCPHHYSSKVAQVGAKRDARGLRLHPQRRASVRVRAQPPWPWGTLPWRPTSSLPHPEYWGDLHSWGCRRSWEHRSQGSEFLKGTLIITLQLILLTDLCLHQEIHSPIAGDASPVEPHNWPTFIPNTQHTSPTHSTSLLPWLASQPYIPTPVAGFWHTFLWMTRASLDS